MTGPLTPSGEQFVQNTNTTEEVAMSIPSAPKKRKVEVRPDYGLVYDFLKGRARQVVKPQALVEHLESQGVPNATYYRGCLNWATRVTATAAKRERYGVPGLVLPLGRGRFVYDPDAYADPGLSSDARTVVVSPALAQRPDVAPGDCLAKGTRDYPPVYLATKDVSGRQVEIEVEAPHREVPQRGDLLEVLDFDKKSRSAVLKDENGNIVLVSVTQVINLKP